MMAISIPQPDAWLVVRGYKNLKNRNWRLTHRGPLLVHAGSLRVTFDEYDLFTANCKSAGIWAYPGMDDFELGGIVGQIDVVDCRQVSRPGPVGRKEYAIISKDPCVYAFEPMKGRRKIWYVDQEIELRTIEYTPTDGAKKNVLSTRPDEVLSSGFRFRAAHRSSSKISSTASAIAQLGEKMLNREHSLHGC